MSEPTYRQHLSTHDRIEHGIIAPMAAWLTAGQPLHVLDAGCGKGAPALVFAEQGCTVTGIDADAGEVETARQLLTHTPFAATVDFQPGDMLHPNFPDASFDLVWTSYVLHHVADKLAAVRELARVLKPGDRLAIREDGLPVQMLPFRIGIGAPGLQNRLHAADDLWFTRMLADTLPDEVDYPFGWAQLLIDAGFTDITARTFTLDLLPPFDAVQSEFALDRLRKVLKSDTSPYGPILGDDDRAAVQALVDPASPHYLLNRADLHLRYALSVYVGTKIG